MLWRRRGRCKPESTEGVGDVVFGGPKLVSLLTEPSDRKMMAGRCFSPRLGPGWTEQGWGTARGVLPPSAGAT